MIQKLGSIKLAFYTLVALGSLMGTGIYLSREYQQGFRMLNDIAVLDWLKLSWADTPVLCAWFLMLCSVAGILFINALYCSLSKQLQVARKSRLLQKWVFLVLHSLFIVILACHGLILVVGTKQTHLRVFPHESIQFGNQYQIVISDIVFTDDINILKADKKKQRALMTQKNIHRHRNYAHISLFKDSNRMAEKQVILLSPLKHDSLQVTVTDFIVKEKGPPYRVGVNLTITDNPLNHFFFTIYALMILTLGVYILLTFQEEPFRANQN